MAGIPPTFSIATSRHHGMRKLSANLGFEMKFMSGPSQCFEGPLKPIFTPVVSNEELKWTRLCRYTRLEDPDIYSVLVCPGAYLDEWINKGVYTIDNFVGLYLTESTEKPLKFFATFGTEAAPPTTSTYWVTITATSTATIPADKAAPAPTITIVKATSTNSHTTTATVPVTRTLYNLNTVCTPTDFETNYVSEPLEKRVPEPLEKRVPPIIYGQTWNRALYLGPDYTLLQERTTEIATTTIYDFVTE